jgi:hypothetical protein
MVMEFTKCNGGGDEYIFNTERHNMFADYVGRTK